MQVLEHEHDGAGAAEALQQRQQRLEDAGLVAAGALGLAGRRRPAAELGEQLGEGGARHRGEVGARSASSRAIGRSAPTIGA